MARDWTVGLVVRELRYGAREMRAAAQAGRRPRPQRVRVVRQPAETADAAMDRYEAALERAARQRLRISAGRVRGLVNSPRGPLRTARADEVDVLPVRHRHAADHHRLPLPYWRPGRDS
ncbi:hypothetical protein [Streptomyces sp. NPDC048603]|uniref:hypothetical protein n=1 Tax=Streptomyces sp. NPDC048603 TaxID=3365577 RepID=UPI00371E8DDF